MKKRIAVWTVMAVTAAVGIGSVCCQAETKDAKKKEKIDRSAVFELFDQMNVGWNLGNTFDAIGAGNTLRSETYWGNPQTTKEMLEAVAAQGFNTVRIPVTWAEHVDAEDYTIDAAWLDRVEEVVDYALDQDMYVILNTHHEPDFWLKPQPELLDEVKEELNAIWTQIAERFESYDEHLIFEGMNEPRNKGSQMEWNGGTKEERAVVNELNQAFVDAVRAVGGNNETRCLILCTYGNTANFNTLTELAIPEDANIAVALHLYTPYFFTYEPDNGSIPVWDGSMRADIIKVMQMIDKYLIQKGVPAIVTEFGAVTKEYKDDQGRMVENTDEVLKWLKDYMETANRFGLPCVWWDNGNFSKSGERFGIFNRRELSWYVPEVADALIEYAPVPQAEEESSSATE